MEIVFKYFPDLSDFQVSQYKRLEPLYKDWNEKINVISRKDFDHLAERHVLHSLGIAKVIHFMAGTKVLDVGTGGGFPGIPLAIFFPEVQFHLVDSIGKKIKVVKAVADDLGLKNVTAEQARVEELKGNYDFIISRAVTRLPVFYNWVHHMISLKSKNKLENGILYLKGGDLAEEISTLNNRCQIFSLSDFFAEPFFETKKVVYLSDFRQF